MVHVVSSDYYHHVYYHLDQFLTKFCQPLLRIFVLQFVEFSSYDDLLEEKREYINQHI